MTQASTDAENGRPPDVLEMFRGRKLAASVEACVIQSSLTLKNKHAEYASGHHQMSSKVLYLKPQVTICSEKSLLQ